MNYKIRITRQAKHDLRSIYDYIAFQLEEPQTAAKVYKGIKAQIAKLTEMPERHPLYPDEPWYGYGLRRLVVGNYLVFYWIDSADNAVAVMRVMYGGRDIGRQLEETVF